MFVNTQVEIVLSFITFIAELALLPSWIVWYCWTSVVETAINDDVFVTVEAYHLNFDWLVETDGLIGIHI